MSYTCVLALLRRSFICIWGIATRPAGGFASVESFLVEIHSGGGDCEAFVHPSNGNRFSSTFFVLCQLVREGSTDLTNDVRENIVRRRGLTQRPAFVVTMVNSMMHEQHVHFSIMHPTPPAHLAIMIHEQHRYKRNRQPLYGTERNYYYVSPPQPTRSIFRRKKVHMSVPDALTVVLVCLSCAHMAFVCFVWVD